MTQLCPCCRQSLPGLPRLIISQENQTIAARGRFVHVPPERLTVAFILAASFPKAVPYERIIEGMWGWQQKDAIGCPGILRTQISKLRRELEPLGFGIVNVWGVGYRLVDQEATRHGTIEADQADGQRAALEPV